MTKTFDPYDELASMFLTQPAVESDSALHEAQGNSSVLGKLRVERNGVAAATATTAAVMSPTHTAREAASRRKVELLITGNLPVRGSLWLTPYVDALARQTGSTAFVRLDSDEASLQLLRALSDLPSPANVSLQQAILSLGHEVDTWVIRPSTSGRAADYICAGIDRITILSSADETAIVAAYQLIKEFAQAAEQTECALPSVGLAIVGADATTAADVVDRLNRTVVKFLDIEVKLAMCLPRIDAGVKCTRYTSFSGEPQRALTTVLEWIDQARKNSIDRKPEPSPIVGQLYADRTDAQVSTAASILKDTPLQHGASKTSMNDDFMKTTSARNAMSAGMSSTPRHNNVQHAEHDMKPTLASTPMKLVPKPTMNVEPKNPQSVGEVRSSSASASLASYVGGLTSLPIRAPLYDRVELAIDADGCVHLLAQEVDGQAMREMQIVDSWLTAHRALIAMACPQHRIDHTAQSVRHIFTAEPATLADLHNTGVRLHVLAPLVVNGMTGWYSAPLNTHA